MGSSSRLRNRSSRHDRFYRQAKTEKYPARSIYKLQEIDKRFGLLKPGQRVLDLGCRPGSWLIYAAEVVGRNGIVVGIDRKPLDIVPADNMRLVIGDLFDIDPDELLRQAGGRFDVVLSDMAPDTTGISFTDQARSVDLFLKALEIAHRYGAPESSFVGKLFMGEGFDGAVVAGKKQYKKNKTIKPIATRKESVELYFVGQYLKEPSGPQSGESARTMPSEQFCVE